MLHPLLKIDDNQCHSEKLWRTAGSSRYFKYVTIGLTCTASMVTGKVCLLFRLFCDIFLNISVIDVSGN